MLKVSVYAPFVKNDITSAALQFSDWLLRCGFDVDLLTDNPIKPGIHAGWQTSARRLRSSRSVYKWAHNANYICWFLPNRRIFELAKLVSPESSKKSTKNIYFPSFSRVTADQQQIMQYCDRIFSFSRHLQNQVLSLNSGFKSKCTWATLVSPDFINVPKQGYVSAHVKKILVILDKYSELDLPPGFFDSMATLLDMHSDLQLTFSAIGATASKFMDSALEKLYFAFPSQVLKSGNIGLDQYPRVARQYDFVYLASTRHKMGGILSSLMVSTVPVICHNVSPVYANILDEVTGIIIPGEEHSAFNGMVRLAEVHNDRIINTISGTLKKSERVLKRLQTTSCFYIKKRQETFKNFIESEFIA